MTGYIEREAALKEFEKVCNVCMALVNKPMCGDCSVADTIRKVKSIPAADVRPVVRGEWSVLCEYVSISENRRRKTNVKTWMCSNCFVSNGRRKTNFCPNCGAMMEES